MYKNCVVKINNRNISSDELIEVLNKSSNKDGQIFVSAFDTDIKPFVDITRVIGIATNFTVNDKLDDTDFCINMKIKFLGNINEEFKNIIDLCKFKPRMFLNKDKIYKIICFDMVPS